MLISVLITNYNYSKYILEAVESVISQDYKNIEIIIVDDGSTDNSYDILDLIEKKHSKTVPLKIIKSKNNLGKLAALNIAIPYIQGEYTIILDSDDYLKIDYINISLKKIESAKKINKNIGFVYSDCELVDQDGEFLSKGISSEFEKEKIIYHSYIPECGLTLTKALKEVIPFDETIRVGTKHHKWKRIISNNYDGYYINAPMFCYRMHSSNLSGIGNKILKNVIDQDSYTEKILSGLWPLEK